jgi:hypothetical protein
MALSLKDLPANRRPRQSARPTTLPPALKPWQLPHADFAESARYDLPLPQWDWLLTSTLPTALFQILQHAPKASWTAMQFQELGLELLTHAARQSYWLSCIRQKVPLVWLQREQWWQPLRIPIPRFLATEQK